ncbi:hypothetical protein MHK03_11880 [Corynebacterium simulans]|uniref:hypothetical protein n=1 Tax=Corynebacterium simulans TaxID=146827 RepID=UPI001EF23568|nr:hypothetical protein [Corynebacterium simulans]MCG7248608.1 hypothetical protein [Corynebacterium simulans]
MSNNLGDITSLLEKLGRASTPAVKESGYGISFIELIGGAAKPSSDNATLVIAPQWVLDEWPREISEPVSCVPGIAQQQAMSAQISSMFIHPEAFTSGVWLNSHTGANHHLAQEIFDAGRELRARGRNVLVLNGDFLNAQHDSALIRATCTVQLDDIPEEDLEEQAPQSPLWNWLISLNEKNGEE